ncbi:MAG: hypothetical protein JJU37_04180 [Balneolaceae bacterium]|nr:hypothetical protein [Balneolaceae bacterium]
MKGKYQNREWLRDNGWELKKSTMLMVIGVALLFGGAADLTAQTDEPPSEVLQGLDLPGDLPAMWQTENIRLERGAIRYAHAPVQMIQRMQRRWNEDKVMEAALHNHNGWENIRNTAIGEVRYIQPRSGSMRQVVVKEEESETEGLRRWVFYQYEDLSELGMDDFFIPRVAVEKAMDGTSATFIRLDPDGQTGLGHFGKSGWSMENGRMVYWIYTVPDTDYSSAIFSFEEEGDTVISRTYTTGRQLTGELRYSKSNGAGSFMAPGQNNDLPICWDSSMNNSEC